MSIERNEPRAGYSPSCRVVAPRTTNIRGLPSEVTLEPADDPIPRTSAVNLDSIDGVSLATLTQRLGRLGDERMRPVCDALNVRDQLLSLKRTESARVGQKASRHRIPPATMTIWHRRGGWRVVCLLRETT